MVVVGWIWRVLHARQAQGIESKVDASRWRYRTIILGGASKRVTTAVAATGEVHTRARQKVL